MSFGAGTIAAKRYKAAHIVDPRPYAVGSIKETYSQYLHLNSEIPAMGYSQEQIHELEVTINNAEGDLVIFATPIDLPKLLSINKPTLRVRYEYKDLHRPTLEETLLTRIFHERSRDDNS
jgi:predicted GTPase